MVKKILILLLWTLTAAAVVTALIVGRQKYRNATVDNIIIIKEHNSGSFINDSIIKASLLSLCDTGITKVKDTDIRKIEDTLKHNPWIETLKVYIGVDRKLNIDITEHKPLLRLFDNKGNTAYVSANGFIFPTNNSYSPHSIVANGYFGTINDSTTKLIDSIPQHKLIKDAINITQSLQRDKFMNACIGQIFLNKDGDFELVPKSANNITIIVGDAENIDDKIKKTSIFLQNKMETKEFLTYNKINAKYRNQIVCTKK